MGFTVGVVGAGQFSQCFIPLFQAHPYVDEVVLAELISARREKFAKYFQLKQTFDSLEQLLQSDVDAVAIFTQRHMHGAQVLQALRAGKHVYSAVPLAQSLEEVSAIMDEVRKTGLLYMTGETSYYYPSAVYCREQFTRGRFGEFVYGEAQYLHDMSHGFYDAFQYSGGEHWRRVAGIPPMLYPTHTVSMILSVTGATSVKVSCLGYRDRHEDRIFGEGNNNWNNPFSNETAFIRTSDGGMMRLNEFRRVGWGGRHSVYMSIFGTHGSFEEHAGSAVWSSLEWGETLDVTDKLTCQEHYVNIDREDRLHASLNHDFSSTLSQVHRRDRLPASFRGKPNGHLGSHQFLVDDFMKALRTMKLPPNHVWAASRYVVPGLVAHESALKDGEWLAVPDLGNPPANWELLDPESFRAENE